MISILTRWYHGKWISWENLSISHYFSEYGYHGENYDQPRFICAASLFSETRTWGFSYIKAWDLSKKNRRNSSWFNHQPFCIKTAEFQDFGWFWSILKRGITMHYILFLVTWSGTILTVFDHGMEWNGCLTPSIGCSCRFEVPLLPHRPVELPSSAAWLTVSQGSMGCGCSCFLSWKMFAFVHGVLPSSWQLFATQKRREHNCYCSVLKSLSVTSIRSHSHDAPGVVDGQDPHFNRYFMYQTLVHMYIYRYVVNPIPLLSTKKHNTGPSSRKFNTSTRWLGYLIWTWEGTSYSWWVNIIVSPLDCIYIWLYRYHPLNHIRSYIKSH